MTEDASETGDAHVMWPTHRGGRTQLQHRQPPPPRTHKQQREHSGDARPEQWRATAVQNLVQYSCGLPGLLLEGGAVSTLRGSVSVVRTPRHANATPPNRAAADSSQRIGPRPVRRPVADSLGFRLINYGPELSLDVWPPDRCRWM
jgi:hypothetical protein